MAALLRQFIYQEVEKVSNWQGDIIVNDSC